MHEALYIGKENLRYEWLQTKECHGMFVVGTVLFGATNEKASKDL